jgi:predicted HTH domain antitoxin
MQVFIAILQLELPGDLLDAARMTGDELRVELAVHLFEQQKLSLGNAAELAGYEVSRFMLLLGARDIAQHYDVDAYEADLKALERMRLA